MGTELFSTNAVVGSNVGSYGITGAGLTANNGNYTFIQAPRNATALTINPATLTVAANAASRLYGATEPAFSGSVTGFVAGDTQLSATTGTEVFSTNALVGSNVGNYGITGAGLTANNGNYTFLQAAGNSTALTITPAPATVTAPTIDPTPIPVTPPAIDPTPLPVEPVAIAVVTPAPVVTGNAVEAINAVRQAATDALSLSEENQSGVRKLSRSARCDGNAGLSGKCAAQGTVPGLRLVEGGMRLPTDAIDEGR
jgi:hypothetical protein